MNIQSTKNMQLTEKIRLMVFGKSFTGKTTLISTLPEKALVLSSDKGLIVLKKFDVDYFSMTSFTKVTEFLSFLKTDECKQKYNWICFDSVTAIADMLYFYLLDEKKLDGHKLWGEYGNFMIKFLTFIKNQNDYHTLSIYESLDKEDESGITVQSYGVKGAAADKIQYFYDEIFSLRKIGKDRKRILQTEESPGYFCKDRSGALLINEEPDLGNIIKKITGV